MLPDNLVTGESFTGTGSGRRIRSGRETDAIVYALTSGEDNAFFTDGADTYVTTLPVGKPRSHKPIQGLFYSDKFARHVALTFDDGPDPVNTPKVLDILQENGVKATFFVTGQNAECYPQLIERIVAEGHTLGNHTWDHPDLTKLCQDDIASEFNRTQSAVDKALGYHYELIQVRPPYGNLDQEVRDVIRSRSCQAILWNVDSNDWRYPNDDANILRNVFCGSSSIYVSGGVILFHDVHPQTVRILDDVIERLRREKFQIEKTDEFLKAKYGPIQPGAGH